MTKRSIRRLRQKDRIRARLAGDPIPDTPEGRKKIEAAYEAAAIDAQMLVDLKRLAKKSGPFTADLSAVRSWRIIVETEEGGEWWSQPIRSVLEPTVKLVKGVKSYRIEEI